jgi:Ni2+-binding GTPase involved in maturation of urease and hydrogenase
MSNPFKPDPERNDTIKRVHEFLDSSVGESILRIEGPVGVGKTRLILEAVTDPKYESRTLYALNAD